MLVKSSKVVRRKEIKIRKKRILLRTASKLLLNGKQNNRMMDNSVREDDWFKSATAIFTSNVHGLVGNFLPSGHPSLCLI